MSSKRIQVIKKPTLEIPFEFVERKGRGHPDTLADGLAEELSIRYSQFTNDSFGAVLHHNFDKLSLLGGASFVRFGEGYLTKPIRIILNGRASLRFGNTDVDFGGQILSPVVNQFFSERFPEIDASKDLDVINLMSTQSSPGKTDEEGSEKGTRKYWFEPRSLEDIRELKHLGANDTAIGVGYAPLTDLEKTILTLEQLLNGSKYKKDKRWLGSDIKIMGARIGEDHGITLCIPQISRYVQSNAEYKDNLRLVYGDILTHLESILGKNVKVNLNTRDNFDLAELYLTAIGSSIESGDEGVVGRGNRLNGLISSVRPYSIEGLAAKNPVYHAGKLYNLLAQKLAEKIHSATERNVEVYLVSQSGRLLKDPWRTIVSVDGNVDEKIVEQEVENGLENIQNITSDILRGKNYLQQ